MFGSAWGYSNLLCTTHESESSQISSEQEEEAEEEPEANAQTQDEEVGLRVDMAGDAITAQEARENRVHAQCTLASVRSLRRKTVNRYTATRPP